MVQEKRAKMRRWAENLALCSGEITLSNEDRKQLAWDLLIVLADNKDANPEH